MNRVAVTLAFLLMLSPAHATVINVPGDQSTIQAGIDVALPGDTVLVEPSEYSGDGNRDLDFHGKNIRLALSELGPLGVFLNCEGTESEPHRGFWLHSGEDSTAVIDGFTIINAYAPEWDNAAVLIEGASPKLINCVIENNVGNGVRVNQGQLLMYDCIVRDNSGSGVRVDEAPAVISGCEITSNALDGVFWNAQWYGHRFDMVDCLVRSNYGIGVYLMIGSGTFHVRNCTFALNVTGFTYDWNFPKANLAETSAAIDTSIVENCISAFNTQYGFVSHVWAGEVAVRCNDAYGNQIEDFHNVGVGPGDVYDNISEDPLFCDPAAGDFTLSGSSPCLPENNDCGTLMGAFGIGCDCCLISGDVDRSGHTNLLDADYLVGWLFRGGPAPICREEADVDANGQPDILDIDYIIDWLFRSGPAPVPCS
ncbi:MAG: right-handed parallel beta-helix repeat-containing protein [Candidatus Zixiibacteriota bacterium]|nr:MAG: right-handed parallel beta-helix repeat-containing protein [candidate division Zixibacteria bacterium]